MWVEIKVFFLSWNKEKERKKNNTTATFQKAWQIETNWDGELEKACFDEGMKQWARLGVTRPTVAGKKIFFFSFFVCVCVCVKDLVNKRNGKFEKCCKEKEEESTWEEEREREWNKLWWTSKTEIGIPIEKPSTKNWNRKVVNHAKKPDSCHLKGRECVDQGKIV